MKFLIARDTYLASAANCCSKFLESSCGINYRTNS